MRCSLFCLACLLQRFTFFVGVLLLLMPCSLSSTSTSLEPRLEAGRILFRLVCSGSESSYYLSGSKMFFLLFVSGRPLVPETPSVPVPLCCKAALGFQRPQIFVYVRPPFLVLPVPAAGCCFHKYGQTCIPCYFRCAATTARNSVNTRADFIPNVTLNR